ncbi:MAG: flippase [Candidatus Moranbacteria bacterium]|nr:flippase [Candidatus Moranbacteria bacterium]
MSKQYLARSIFWLTISEIIFNISGYIIHSGVGRILGPADYGRYGLVITLTTMIIVLIGNGIPTAMSKFLSEVFEKSPSAIRAIKKQALIIQSFLIGSITILFFLLAPILSASLGDPSLTKLFRISSLIIPSFAAASFYFYYLTGIHRFDLQAMLKTVRSVARVFFILMLARIFGIEGSVYGYIAAPFFVFLIALNIDRFFIAEKIEKAPDKKKPAEFHWKKLINYAWPFTLFLLFYEIMISIDLYLVKSITGNDYLTGIYNGALTVGRIPYYLFYALTIVLLPTISKTTSQNNSKETRKTVQKATRLMLILLPIGAILMSIFASPILSIFYGNEYAAGAGSMQILVFGVCALTVFYVLSFAFSGAGKVGIPMWIAFGGMIINIILSYVLIQKYGITGAAAATTITSFFVMLVSLYLAKKEFGSFIKLKSIARITVASFSVIAISVFLPSGKYIFILWSILLSASYFTALYLLKELDKEDLSVFNRILKK